MITIWRIAFLIIATCLWVAPAWAQALPGPAAYVNQFAPAVSPTGNDILPLCQGCSPQKNLTGMTLQQLSTYLGIQGSGINQLTNDVLAGPGVGIQSSTVVGIRGTSTCASAPTTPGQLMGYNGTCWGPVAAAATGMTALTQDVSAAGTGSRPATVTGLQSRPIASTAPTTGQCLVWNGSQWAPGSCGTAPTTSAMLIATGSALLIETGSKLLIQ